MKLRKVTNEELADLSDEWENSLVDTRKYYQQALNVWEVNEELYKSYKQLGGLCQEKDGKYYIA